MPEAVVGGAPAPYKVHELGAQAVQATETLSKPGGSVASFKHKLA